MKNATEIIEVNSQNAVNKYLDVGWELLKITDNKVYILGWTQGAEKPPVYPDIHEDLKRGPVFDFW